ncbi:MAG TPA: sensor histidine kinase [Polyangia bacterium]|nr:sensor histidine kinase [Polyangia bacterium]
MLVVSIGLAGGTTIYQSARTMRRELTTEYQLFAENRAFALRDNFEILEDELKRLALLPEMNPTDADLLQEQQILAGAHAHSVLYNTAVLLLDRHGRCVRSVPDRSAFGGQNFGDRPWFQAVRAGAGGPLFRITDEPALGQTLKIVQPVVRGAVFAGALVGVIALAENNLISPTFHENLPPHTDAVLIDEVDGTVIYPPGRATPADRSGWADAIGAARSGATGTLIREAGGQKMLFAYSPVGAATRYAVVFAWPWRVLTANIEQQGATLAGILVFGIIVALFAGLALSAYISRPLQALADGAIRIARGQPRLPDTAPRPAGTEEISTLLGAFRQMEQAIQKRDQDLREGASLLEQRVRDRTQELVATQAALVDAERFAAMGKTSAAIAHELKNALNGLGMAVELIAQDPQNSARLARLRPQVLGEIARLRDVVDSLLSFSRSPRIARGPADLAGVVARAVEAVADLVADRAVALRVDVPPAMPVWCDAHKIQGVLVNLIKNAVEAGHAVSVTAAMRGGEAVVEVADDGPGLSAEAREHLFEPFFTTKPNGTGLGLPTSRRFVEAHGGQIEVDRAPQGGALFRVRLPIATTAEEDADAQSRSDAGGRVPTAGGAPT